MHNRFRASIVDALDVLNKCMSVNKFSERRDAGLSKFFNNLTGVGNSGIYLLASSVCAW